MSGRRKSLNNLKVCFSLLKGTPPLLSQGNLKRENEYGFVDLPGEDAYLNKEGHSRVPMSLRSNTPYMVPAYTIKGEKGQLDVFNDHNDEPSSSSDSEEAIIPNSEEPLQDITKASEINAVNNAPSPFSEIDELSGSSDIREKANCKPCILAEHFLNHFPKRSDCDICNQCKI